jgi:hypothetical protein
MSDRDPGVPRRGEAVQVRPGRARFGGGHCGVGEADPRRAGARPYRRRHRAVGPRGRRGGSAGLRRRRPRPGRAHRGVVAFASRAGYLVTPGTASGSFGHPVGFRLNLRYAAPALSLALTVGPLAQSGAGKRWQRTSVSGLTAIFAATVAQQRVWAAGYGASALLVAAALVLTASGAALGPRALARSAAIQEAGRSGGGSHGGATRRRHSRVRRATPVDPRPLYGQRGASVTRAALELVQDGAARTHRAGGHARRLLCLSAVGDRRFQRRRLCRAPRPARVIHADHQLPGVAASAPRGALPLRRHDRTPGRLDARSQLLTGGRLDAERSRGAVGRGVPPARPLDPDRCPGSVKPRQEHNT